LINITLQSNKKVFAVFRVQFAFYDLISSQIYCLPKIETICLLFIFCRLQFPTLQHNVVYRLICPTLLLVNRSMLLATALPL